MRIAVGIMGVLLALIIVWDAFEVMVLPRAVKRQSGVRRC